MPLYDYACLKCEAKTQKELGRVLTSEEYDERVLFETIHAMNPTDKELQEATICPRCGSNNCEKSLKNSQALGYIKGNGFLDRDGARRDMHLYHLTQDDPYAEYRQPGEVDDMKSKLKRAGKHDPKTKYFPTSTAEMQKAVQDVDNNDRKGKSV